MANIYSPIGRKGYYSFETVEQQGTRYVWNANLDRWDIYGGSTFENPLGNRAPVVPPTLPPIPGGVPVRPGTGPVPIGSLPAPVTPTAPPKPPTPPKVDPPPPPNVVDINKFKYNQYNFVVKATTDTGRRIFGRLLVNGVDIDRIPKALKYSKDDILAGDKTLTATANGYTTNTSFVISNEVIAGNPGPSGVNRAVVVKKFVNGQLVTSNDDVSSIYTLEFDFKKDAAPTPVPTPSKVETRTLRFVARGEVNAIVLIKDGTEEIELSNGLNTIEAPLNTKFTARIKDGYRLLTFGIGGKSVPYDKGTNPNVLITLDSDINANAVVSKVSTPPPPPPPTIPILVPTPPEPEPIPLPPKVTEEEREEKRLISQPIIPDGPEPLITLLDKKARTHDIKDKSGLPIAFRKNEEVEAVTVFVGTKHYVFDNLGNKPVAGIVIPSSAFQQLGRLEIKIIPYDVDELDDTIEQITRSAITRTKEITEERIVEVRRPVPTPIEIEERYEEPPAPRIPDPKPYPKPPKPKLPPKPDPRTLRPIDKPDYKALDNQGRPVQPTDSVNRGGTGGVTFVSLDEYDRLDATGRKNLGNSNGNFVLDGRIRDRVKREL